MDDSMTSTSTESFEDLDWDNLLVVCREKEEQLNLAGACGLKLHEQLVETQAHIDNMRSQHDQEMERLIQESYELKSKFEVKEKALATQENEFEEFQKQISRKHEQEIEELQDNMKKEVRSVKKEKGAILSDFEQAQLREHQYMEQIETLKKRIQDLQNENMQRVKVTKDDSQEELCEVKEKNLMLELSLAELQERVSEYSSKNQSLTLELSTKSKDVSELRMELEEVEMRCTTYFNHLQQDREEKQEIKAELDMLKAQTRNSTHKTSGNSLFGEVEDRRVEMEKKMLTMQVKYDSLLKAYNFSKNQLHNMKNQVYALLQVKNARADEDHISRLERALSQAKSENTMLTNKLKLSESSQDITKEDVRRVSCLPEFRKSKDLVDFLYSQIEDYKEKLGELQREYDQIFMVKIAESDKLHDAEQKLYETTARADSSSQSNMRLKLKLEETKNKLETEIQKRKMIEKKFNYDSTNDIVPEGDIKQIKKIEKTPMPFSIRKANENAAAAAAGNYSNQSQISKSTTSRDRNGRTKKSGGDRSKPNSQSSREDFMAGMEWHKLPKEILEQLGIEQKHVNNKENTPQQQPPSTAASTTATTDTMVTPSQQKSVNSSSCGDKPRKVSFKDTPEKISFKEIVTNNDANSLNSTTPKESTPKDTITPDCKKKLVSNLKQDQRFNHISPLTNSSMSSSANTNKLTTPKTTVYNAPKKPSIAEEEDENCKVQ